MKEAVESERKISKGVKIFIGAMVGGIIGATLSTIFSLMFFPLDNMSQSFADFEVLFFTGTIGGAFIGGFFCNVFSVIAVALGWVIGMDIDM